MIKTIAPPQITRREVMVFGRAKQRAENCTEQEVQEFENNEQNYTRMIKTDVEQYMDRGIQKEMMKDRASLR